MTITAPPGFDYPVFLIALANGTSFQLWEGVTYTGSQGDSWGIPAGFTSDLASVPASLSWAVPKLGAYSLAALVHDALCEGLNDYYRRGISGGADVPTANAVDTDAIFRKIARDLGTDPVTASLLWTGVRWGALANPARREGWLRTAPAVLGLSVLFAPVLLPATVLAVGGRLVLRAASAVNRSLSRLFRRRAS